MACNKGQRRKRDETTTVRNCAGVEVHSCLVHGLPSLSRTPAMFL